MANSCQILIIEQNPQIILIEVINYDCVSKKNFR